MSAQELVAGVLTGGQYALIALGLSLVMGVLRLVNLAHGEFIVGGAYVTLLCVNHLGLDPLVAMPIAMLAMAAIAYPLQRFLLTPLQLSGPDAPLVATFGLALVAQAIFQIAFTSNARGLNAPYSDSGFSVFGVRVETSFVIAFALAVLMTAVVDFGLTRTRRGCVIRAAARDPATAETLGINLRQVYAITLAISAAIAAAGGVIVGLNQAFSPDSGFELMLGGFAVIAIAGIGNIRMVVPGGIIIGLLQAVAVRLLGGGYSDAAVYVVFFTVLVIRPTGILSREIA